VSRVVERRWRKLGHVIIGLIPLVTVEPAFAAGRNGTSPATPSSTPVITTTPQLSNLGDEGCQQQHSSALSSHARNVIDARTAAATASGTIAAAQIAVFAAQATTSQAAAFTATAVGLGVTAASGTSSLSDAPGERRSSIGGCN
jgi:hypothetical protein